MLCGFSGGESGALLDGLLRGLGAELRLVPTAASSGCYVTDRRSGEREVLTCVLSEPPSRHELDDLVSIACAEGIATGWLAITNPMPGDALALEVYGDLVANARAGGCHCLVDLSSPRLDSALRGRPELVKLNDWELAEYVRGPVGEPDQLRAAAERLLEAGAGTVVVTRGERSSLVLSGEQAWWLEAPALTVGFREGCGDAMLGALLSAMACGEGLQAALELGAGAGAANFLRHGLGSASGEVARRLSQGAVLHAVTASD